MRIRRPKRWVPFNLEDLPLVGGDEHFWACGACQDRRKRSALAYHEATHLAVAVDLGLAVEFCSIDDSQSTEVTALEARLYQGLVRPGMRIPCVVTRLREDMLEKAPKRTLVAMIAPSMLATGDVSIDVYSQVETEMARVMADSLELDVPELERWADDCIATNRSEIVRYATRLSQEGRFEVGNSCAL